MKLVISGGGTGGHVYPAVTIAKEVAKLKTPCEILFIGTKDGLEADIIPREGFDFKTINARGLQRKLTLENIKTLFAAAGGTLSSFKILRAFKPDVVVGTGGFVCGPVLFAASLLKIPVIIQEQNAIPGITNRVLACFANKIALGYEEAAAHFPDQKGKIVITGNPIREEILSKEKNASLDALGLQKNKLTILVSGGSRGARSINEAMLEIYKTKYFVEKTNIQVLHLTGETGYNDIVGNIKQMGIDVSSAGNIIIKPYLHNMPDALAATDLAIFRAGALGLAELTAKGIPAILIPYPYAAENHQEFNARALEKHGAAVVIKDNELRGLTLVPIIDELINNTDKLKNMSQNSLSSGRPDAAQTIARLTVALADSNVK
jgi:UDP-N-acetylglucosamine--N-acetylmuramyl-(pentapeptide) pyrophosphoryl-undecaprenol N-acetylglucosamine transferase